MKPADFTREIQYLTEGYNAVVGIDEVGRGSWAGPLVSVAYRFFTVPSDIQVGDSKTLGESKRTELAKQLVTLGESGVGVVSAEEIDEIGLSPALILSYTRAISVLRQTPDIILLDGRPIDWPGHRVESIIDGDASIASIAAASIIAKVYRDTYMKTVAHDLYPNYGFDAHVGYGTKQHQAALAQLGITPLHRRTYKPNQKYLTR